MQEEQAAGTVPVHHQIADALRGDITSGRLAPGDELPTAAELAERWQCSNLTARKAISVLREEGRITGGRGKPPTVKEREHRHTISLADGWTQVQKDLVLRPEHERREKGAIELTAGIPIRDCNSSHTYEEAEADHELAEIFGLEAGTPVMQRLYEMTHKQTGHRVSWSVSYIPKHLIEGNPKLLDDGEEPWPGGHQHQLYTVGIELDRFERTIYSVQPTPGERQRWGMDVGAPMLHVLSKSVDTNDRVVEFSEARYPADRTEITLTENLKRWTREQLAEAGDA